MNLIHAIRSAARNAARLAPPPAVAASEGGVGANAIRKAARALPLLLALAAALLLATACASRLTTDGEMVRLAGPEDIKQCRHIGNTRISLDAAREKLFSSRIIAESLENEARNFARRIGGDSVLPVSEVSEAAQVFGVYDCRAPSRRKRR